MNPKDNLVQVYNYLASDPTILSLMGLSGATPETIMSRICKTKMLGNVTDGLSRMAIWEGKPKPLNHIVSTRQLTVDILVPLAKESSTGLALDLADKVQKLLGGKPIGRGLDKGIVYPDQQTAFGWYKASVVFNYNYI